MEITTNTISKEEWMHEYAQRILRMWQTWQTPLGVDDRYCEVLKEQLSEYFDDPLKRELIEATY